MTNYFKYQKVITCKDTGEICVGYENYLKSKHWLIVRNSIITPNTECAVCGEKNTHLQLHHKTYERIGNESVNDLIPLCENCHKLVHKAEDDKFIKRLKQNGTNKKSQKNRKRVCENCRSFCILRISGKKQSYCQYYCEPVYGKKKACDKYSTKKYANWCRK